MKQILVLFTLISITLPVNAIQLQESQIQRMNNSSSSSNTTKIYDQYGSYQYKLVQKPNGQVRQYGKTGSFEGVYKKQGSKVKFYRK